jgi:hypothetical protein
MNEHTDYRDGKWHALPRYSPQPIKVHTLKGVQHHYGSHSFVQRWTGKDFEYDRCGDIHKSRGTTLKCAERFARFLNKK